MKHHKISAIIFLLLTVVLIFSSCSLRDSEPEISKKIEDTPEPELVIKGKNGLGMFKLTVTDEISRISTLEFTDALPSDSIDELPNGIEANRVYQITLSLDEVERSNRVSNGTVITFDRYVLSADNGYKISVRTVFSGQGVKKHLEGEKQKLKDALDRGEISQQAYQRSLSILDGDYILYESGESFKATVTAYSNGSAYLSRAEYDADGDGIFETSTSTDETAHNVIIKKTYGTSVLTVKTSRSGNVISEALGVITGETVVPVYEKLLDSDGRTTTYLEYHENGRLKKGTDYFENEIPKYITEYGENGIKTRTIEYYSSGNHKKETVYYESGSVKTRFEYEDKKDSTPIRTDYIEGSNKPIPDGEAVDIDKFVNDFGGFWTGDDTVYISSCDGVPFVRTPIADGIISTFFIDQVKYDGVYYHVGIKNSLEDSLYGFVSMKFEGSALTVRLEGKTESFTYDPDRKYLGDEPESLGEMLDISALESFLGTWTDYFYQGQFVHFAKVDGDYVMRLGRYETCMSYQATVDSIYLDSTGKYTVVCHTETYYDEMDSTVSIGQVASFSFYDAPDGNLRLISANEESVGFDMYALDPRIQLDEDFKTNYEFSGEVYLTAVEFGKIFGGVWENGTKNITIGYSDGKATLVRSQNEAVSEAYEITDVELYEKSFKFILTLNDGAEEITLELTPNITFDTVTVYENGGTTVYTLDK